MQLECGQVYKDIWLRHIPEQQQQTVVSHKNECKCWQDFPEMSSWPFKLVSEMNFLPIFMAIFTFMSVYFFQLKHINTVWQFNFKHLKCQQINS